MAVSGQPTFLAASISEKADAYREVWQRHVALVSSADSSRRFNYLREQLVLCYEGILLEEEHNDVKLTSHEVATIMAEFKNQLDQLTLEETKDLYRMCLKLICRTRYSKGPAERFLIKMDEVAKSNPKMTPREAGAVATLEYICDWVFSQSRVVGL
jgi:hypothetical protein